MKPQTLLISPYSAPINSGRNPKDYAFWHEVVAKLKAEGWEIWQIGINQEKQIPGIDQYYDGLNYRELEALLRDATVFASVDNFFHHFAHVMGVMGVVIFSVSDPNIFSHPTHFNLLKDRKHLRGNQFAIWQQTEYNPNSFIDSDEVVKVIKHVKEFRYG